MPVSCSRAEEAREKFAAVRSALCGSLVEREDEIDLALAALVAGEHLLLVGPPGLAKSALLDGLLACAGGRKFSVLLSKFTTPEELFGPLSLSALKADRYVRVTAGRLPEAEFAFVDEVWKASSAILNTLLKLLNERVYDAGDGGRSACSPAAVRRGLNDGQTPNGQGAVRRLTASLFRKAVAGAVGGGRSRLLDTFEVPKSSTHYRSDLDAAPYRVALPWSAQRGGAGVGARS